MIIERLEIKGLYGYINKEIDFFKDLTLLVGINGSGKTSILNIIHWIIRPSIANLCITEFKSIKLVFSFKSTRYTIVCRHNKTSLTYNVNSDKEEYHPLTVRINVPPSELNNDDSLKANLVIEYSHLKPDNKERKTWDLLATFPNPIIIGLDRYIDKEESERQLYEDSFRGKIARESSTSNLSPLQRVKDILNTDYRKRKNNSLNLTNKLKNHLMLSTFDGGITIDSFTTGIKRKLNLEQIQAAEDRVTSYFNQFEVQNFTESAKKIVVDYFAKLKEITQQYLENKRDETVKLLYGLNANQFTKVNTLLHEFESFEKASNREFERINLFLDTINYFLADSSKKLLFKEDTFEIAFNSLDKFGIVLSEYRDIKFLSSGEQQILILFSYMAFNNQDGSIFIIDEPELSLHIKWQEEFLDYLEKITDTKTQTIIATHSPVIASKKKKNAIILFPYNE